MKKIALILGALLITAFVIQPGIAGSFSIYVIYQDGSPAANAYVEVWQGGGMIDSGPADGNGIFSTSLREGGTYHITAKAPDGRTGVWDGQAYGTITVKI